MSRVGRGLISSDDSTGAVTLPSAPDILPMSQGGTGQDTSAVTGQPELRAGTWSFPKNHVNVWTYLSDAQRADVLDGTGLVDCTAEITSAIAAAAVSGGAVYFPPGTYLCDSLLIDTKTNVTLFGAGAASILKLGTAPTQNIQGYTTWLFIKDSTGIMVRDLAFDLNNKEHVAIGIQGSTGVRVTGTSIHNSPGTIGDSRPAILAHSSVAVRIDHNHVYDVSTWIAFGLSTTLGQITDSTLDHNIFRNAKATSAGNATRSTITGNIFDTSLGAGLELVGVTTPMVDWTVSGNVFANCANPGLQVAAVGSGGMTNRGAITGNIFRGNTVAGLYVFGDVGDLAITGNQFLDNDSQGLALVVGAAGGVKRVTITGNQFYDTRTAGARTQDYGIAMNLGNSHVGTMTGEQLSDILISSNLVRNHVEDGIRLGYDSGNATIRRVTIHDNQVIGNNNGISVAVAGGVASVMRNIYLTKNLLSGQVSQDVRMTVNAADVNAFLLRDNTTLSTTTYTFIAGVPTLLGLTGEGSPEGAVVAGLGSTYHNVSGGAVTSLYLKESGTGNTGWIAK